MFRDLKRGGAKKIHPYWEIVEIRVDGGGKEKKTAPTETYFPLNEKYN